MSKTEESNFWYFKFPFLWLSLALLSIGNGYAQSGKVHRSEVKISEDSVFIIEEIEPVFPGGFAGIKQIISDSLIYPPKSARRRIGGKVFVKFILDTTGNPINFEIAEGINNELNSEAIRVISLLKNWTPAYQNGKKVPIIFTIPIRFYPSTKKKI